MAFPKGGSGPLFVLQPHAPCAAVRAVTAEVRRTRESLELRYALEAELSALRLAAPGEGELWQHTCFEIFLAQPGMPSYHEFNFSSAGEWRAYAFSRYREGRPLADGRLDPRIEVREAPGRLELAARVPLDVLALPGELALGLSAVIEAADGALSYWALRHPPGKPDFHHRDTFAARLDALRT
jgi:hypothetical protein